MIGYEEVILNELMECNRRRDLSDKSTFDFKTMKEFKDKIYWQDYIMHNIIDSDILKEHKDKINWNYISRRFTITKEFLDEFKYELLFTKKRIPDGYEMVF